jgi:tetratricopeptide (TPR) repeat protein
VVTNAELRKALESLDRSIASLELDAALGLIDAAIKDSRNADYKPHFEVHKAGVLWAAGKLQEAVTLLERCATANDGIDSVHYFAGEYLTELGEFARALRYLSRCIEIADVTGDGWFEDSARLLRAYCAAKTGKFNLARDDLAKIDDDDAMGWLNTEPVVSKASIARMLEKSG